MDLLYLFANLNSIKYFYIYLMSLIFIFLGEGGQKSEIQKNPHLKRNGYSRLHPH